MARKRNEIIQRIRARQQAAREKRHRVVRYPTGLASVERILPLVGKDSGINWYALLVASQKEFAAQEVLARKGFITYCPTERRWRKVSRFVQDKEAKSYPLVPGYVFVGLPAGNEPWHQVLGMNMVRGCVGHDGRPFPMPFKSMESMVRRFRNGFQRPDEERFMRTYREFKRGDLVRLAAGPFAGIEAKVIEIDGPMSRILMEILGVQRPVLVETEALEPAA